MSETKNVNVNWGNTPISVVPMRGPVGVTGIWGVTGISIQGVTGVGYTGAWGVTGVDVATPNGLAINTDNSNPTAVNGGTVCFVSASGTNGAGATAGKNGRNINFRVGDGGTSGSGMGGNGGNFQIDIGSGGVGGGGTGENGGFSVSINGVPLLTILGHTSEVFVGENAQTVYVGASTTGGGTNGAIHIGQDGCDAINIGKGGGNCFVTILGHFNVDEDYADSVELINPDAVPGSVSRAGGIAVYHQGNFIGYIPVLHVA